MADADIQAILGLTEKSPQIIQRVNASTTVHSYFCSGGAVYPGRYRWVDVPFDDSDEDKATAIQAALLS